MLLLPAPGKASLVSQSHLAQQTDSPLQRSSRTSKRVTSQEIARYLRLPTRESAAQLQANRHFLAEVESRRIHQQSRLRLRRHLKRWRCEALDSYKELLATDPRSRIIATFHFGDFAFGMNYLLRHDPVGRECIVLTQRVSADAYFDNMRRAFADRATKPEQQWLIGQHCLFRLAKRLRGRPVSLVTFCDLPPQFGAGIEVEFLGRRAQFPRGAVSLALRHRLPILPVICCQRAGNHHLVLTQQIEPGIRAGETASACIARLTQQLTDLLECFVRVYPSQWRFLHSLPAYFSCPPSPTTATTEERIGCTL